MVSFSRLMAPKMLCPLDEQGNPELLEVTSKGDDGQEIKIRVKFVAKKSPQDPTLVHLVNILFGKSFRMMEMYKMPTIGNLKSYFNPAMKETLAKHKLEVWPGYSLTMDHYEGGLFVQCDLANKILRTQTVLDVIKDLFKRGGSGAVQQTVKSELMGKSVLTRYNNKPYKISDVDFDICPTDTFPSKKTGDQVSYVDYYQQRYSLAVKDLKQPLLVSMVKSMDPTEEPRKVLLVPEFCMLCGMTDAQRADFKVIFKSV